MEVGWFGGTWAVLVLYGEVSSKACFAGRTTNKLVSLVEGEKGYLSDLSPNPKSIAPPGGLDVDIVTINEANEAMLVSACFVPA
jgi:hypothetical protein